jgi:DNA-binding LacI/PurR family transcriptional regulator
MPVATQQSIARQLQLAQSTVSRALAGDSRISAQTRARVLEAAAGLGYTPNLVARSLVTSTTRSIGVILATTDYPFYVLAAAGAQQTLMRAGYSTTLCVSAVHAERERAYVQSLLERQVDGLIIISTSLQREVAHLQRFRQERPAVVVVNRFHDDATLDTVLLGDQHGGWLATQHLLALGHRRIGFIGFAPPTPAVSGVETGYRQALAEAGIRLRPDYVANARGSVAGGEEAMARLLACSPPPTAVAAAIDAQAAGALRALVRAGVRVPEDVAIVGHADTVGAAYTLPALTSVHAPWLEAGQRAAELALARLATPDRPPVREDLPRSLVVRESCGAVPLHPAAAASPGMAPDTLRDQRATAMPRQTHTRQGGGA